MSSIQLNLGDNVKRLRSELGMTQSDFAEHAGLSVSFLQNIETGKRWTSPETIHSLARALKVSEADLFRDSRQSSTPDAKQLLQIFCQAFGIEIEEHILKKTKVNRAYSYYAKFYHHCPHDIGDLLLELSQAQDWDWEHLRVSLVKLKTKSK